MANYTCLLMDADDTILDFHAAEQQALIATLANYELSHDAETVETYHRINAELWAAFARNEISRAKLLATRFGKFLRALGVQDTSRADEMSSYYEQQLSQHAELVPGAAEALDELAEVATIALVSNGSIKVQEPRIRDSGIEKYLDGIFISEKLGVAKPAARFFEIALRELGIANKSRVLVVGDDLLADIKGGINAGLDTCWVNFGAQENTAGVSPKYTVGSFEELYRIVMEPEELENVGLRNRRHMNEN